MLWLSINSRLHLNRLAPARCLPVSEAPLHSLFTIDLASPTAVRSLEEWFSGRWKRVLLLQFSEATRRKVSRGQSSQCEPCCRCVVEPYIPSSAVSAPHPWSWEFVYPVRLRCQGPHFIHSVLCLAKDQDLAFSGKLTKLGCAPLGVAAGGTWATF